MNPKLEYLVKQLSDPQTWKGIVLLLTVCGFNIDDEHAKAIMTAGLGLVGVIGIFSAPSKQLTPEAAKAVNQAVADAQQTGAPSIVVNAPAK